MTFLQSFHLVVSTDFFKVCCLILGHFPSPCRVEKIQKCLKNHHLPSLKLTSCRCHVSFREGSFFHSTQQTTTTTPCHPEEPIPWLVHFLLLAWRAHHVSLPSLKLTCSHLKIGLNAPKGKEKIFQPQCFRCFPSWF